MKQTNNSIFTRVLALMLCIIMIASTLLACQITPDVNGGDVIDTTPSTSTSTTTGDSVNNDPVEDPEEDLVDPNEIYSASASLDEDALILGALKSSVLIGDYETAGAIVPEDVKIAEGTSSLALSVKKVVEEMGLPLGEGDTAQSLDVHIEGIALDNTVPMIVNLGAVLEAGLGDTELKLYHMEDGVAVLMTRVNSVNDFAIHNQYYYNAETGEVTIYVASFSLFSMVRTSADVWDGTSDYSWYNPTDTTFTLATAEQFAGFRDIVDGTAVINDATVQDSFLGKTVILGVDIDLKKINFDPIGYGYTYGKDSDTAFMGTFDGGNHTVYNLYEQGWDLENATGKDYTYSTAGAGLFATIENATIKNLAVSGAEIVMECVDMGIVVGYAQGTCHFENIVVTNSTIGNYQRATGGVVGEVCYGPYGTDTTKGYSHTFKNIIVDSSVTVGSLWGDFDNLNGGVIGGKWGDATVKMENVTVAVTLDAYSDVTSAYQWYAYRRSGMLIGHTEQNSPKKAETADAPFLTCENVKVYYGDWVNYTYCQFEHTNNPGYRYPWVRVEEGRNCGAYSNPRYGHPVDFAGKEVTSAEHTHAEGEGHNVLIKFDQLYGGGQGVYGKADHTGVTVVDKNTTTLYIATNATNVKLFYWYDTTWTNVVDGIDLVGQDGTFRADIPAYAQGFKLVVDGVESDEFVLADYADGATITLGSAPCEHEYDNACDTTCNKCEETREVGEHVYDNACDTTCNTCGAVREVGDHTYNNSPYNCDNCQALADTITIYFENTQAWTTLNLNYGELSYSVALSTLTKATNGVNDVYTLAIPTHVDNITISGGTASATPAMTVENLVAGNVYALTSDGKTINSTVYKTGVKTVKFVDEWTWTKNSFKVYYWYSDGKNDWYTADWEHRTAMTLEGTNTYTFDIPAYADGYVISGVYETHTLQTLDQKVTDLETVTYRPIDCVIIDSQKHDGMMTIFYQNDWWYTDVYLYDWDIATDKSTTTWPGTKMTKVGYNGTYDIYAITIKQGHGFKINDGNTSDIRETDNITSGAYDGKMYTGGKSDDKIYLNANIWDKNSARFAAYFFNDSGNKWVNMTYNKQGGVFECAKQTGYSKVIFCRMNKTSTANNWDNKWNQTGNLTVPTTSKNVFTVTAWDGQTTGWSTK